MRLSTPMMKKFSSPFWALGSRMSLELGSSAAMVLSRLFFALCHCHAAPVTASADTAMSTAADRAASSAGRRAPNAVAVRGCGALPAAGFRWATEWAAGPGQRREIGQLVSRRGHGNRDGGIAASSGAGASALRRVTGATPATTGELGDQICDRNAFGVIAGGAGASAPTCRPECGRPARHSGGDVAAGPEWRSRRHSCSRQPPAQMECRQRASAPTQPRCWSSGHPGRDRRSTTRCPCY